MGRHAAATSCIAPATRRGCGGGTTGVWGLPTPLSDGAGHCPTSAMRPAFVGGWAGCWAGTPAPRAVVGAGRRPPWRAPHCGAAGRWRARPVIASASSVPSRGAPPPPREPVWGPTGPRQPPTDTVVDTPPGVSAAVAAAAAAAPLPYVRRSLTDRLAELTGVLRLAAPEWRSLALALVVTLGSTGAFFLRPAVFGKVLDLIAAGGVASIPRPIFVRQALRLGTLYLLCCVLTVAEVATIRTAGERVVARLRRTVFARMVEQDVSAFDTTSTGELMSRLSADTAVVQTVMTTDLSRAVRGSLEVALGLVLSFALSPILTASMLLTVPLTLLSGVVYGARTKALAAGLSDAQAAASVVASEQLAGIRVVKAYVREQSAVSRFTAAVKRIYEAGRASGIADAIQQGTTQLIFSWNTFVILFYGSKLVAAGALTVGSLITFAIYTSNIASGLAKVASATGEIIRASGSARRVLALVDAPPPVHASAPPDDPVVAAEVAAMRGQVTFRGVRFAYPARPTEEALRGVSFDVPPGSTLAIVGKSVRWGEVERGVGMHSGEIRMGWVRDDAPAVDADSG